MIMTVRHYGSKWAITAESFLPQWAVGLSEWSFGNQKELEAMKLKNAQM
jgi:hypothetical protein